MKLKKRGLVGWHLVIVITCAAMIGIIFFAIGDRYTRADFERVYLAKDIALTINALHSVPGDAVVDFENNYMTQFKNQYDIGAKDGAVTILRHGFQQARSSYHYGHVAAHPIDSYYESPSYLAFISSNRKIELKLERSASEEKGCPELDTKADIKSMNIVIEPGQWKDDPGREQDQEKEYEITELIASAIKDQCTIKGYTCRVIQQQDIRSKIQEIQLLNPDLIISVHIGYEDSPVNPAMIGFNSYSEQSKKLSCLMANNMRFLYSPVSESAVDTVSIPDTDNMAILKQAQAAVSIEIGNIRYYDYFRKQDNIAQAAEYVIQAVEQYYE